MVDRAPLRRHRPGLRGGVVETTGEGASGQATCHVDAQRKPSPPLGVVSVAGVGASASVGESASEDGAAGADGAADTPCTRAPRSE